VHGVLCCPSPCSWRPHTHGGPPPPAPDAAHPLSPAPQLAEELAPAAAAAATAGAPPEAAVYPPGFRARRILVFAGLIGGYSAYYLTRNSLTYAAPVMVAEPG
jgi:OPA family sugar phosphate sensor protein UhpC-like MFS transporter